MPKLVNRSLTPKQKKILDFVTNYHEKHDYSPSHQEIARKFHLKSVATVHQHLQALQNKGYLEKEANQPRGILPIQDKNIEIPLLGYIAAGEPIEAISTPEPIKVSQPTLGRSGLYYGLSVKGNSMIEENINDGDIVIIKSQPTAHNGQKVVALIDNSEVTLKKIYKEKNKIRLQPANSNIDPIVLDASRVIIQGIVVDIIKTKLHEIAHRHDLLTNHIIPEHRRPKGGTELIYPGKLTEEYIITNTNSTKLELLKQYGVNKYNKLICGDNLGILKTFYDDPFIKGKVNLIYIDPPFGTGQDFVGYDESKAYSDRLVNTQFLEFIRKRLIFLRELLAENGSIYLHIDQKIGHYIKIIMDEIFGEENFRNDISRIKCNPKNFERKAYGNIKDVIYFYSKTKRSNGYDLMYWSDYRAPLSQKEIIKQFPKIDKFGRRYATTPLHAKGETINGPTGQPWKGLKPPKGRHWRYNPKELTRLDEQKLIEWSNTGNPRKIIYADENNGKKIQDVWDFKDPGFEKSIYPTEKGAELLKHIILASSKEGDLVLDCFAGSGTTLIAAQKFNRHWIGVDSNETAIKVAEKRLLSLNNKMDLFIKDVSFSVYQAD